MSSRNTNEVTSKEDRGYSEQKNPYWREESLSTITQSGRQKDLDDKNYTYPLEKNPPSQSITKNTTSHLAGHFKAMV